MNGVMEVPLLAGLSKVELAKLVGDLQAQRFQAGSTLLEHGHEAETIYLVSEGSLEISFPAGDQEVPLMVVGAGEIFGESCLFGSPLEFRRVRALTDGTLYRLPAGRLQRLIKTEPKVAQALLNLLGTRSTRTAQELARAKFMLSAYTEALWGQLPDNGSTQAAASLPAAQVAGPAPEEAATETAPARRKPWLTAGARRGAIAGIGFALSFLVYRALPVEPKLAAVTAVLFWATFNWLVGVIPDYATSLAASAALVLLGAAKAATAFSGFSSSSWFLLLGAGGIGVAVSRSGLLYRIALHMLRLLPPTYIGQSLAMALTGVLFTPLMPSANSRVAMSAPLAQELSVAMRFPERGRGSAGMAMSTFLGFGLMYFIFLNGANTSLLAYSLMPAAIQRELTWTRWFIWALPLGILLFIGCYAAILYLYRPEPTAGISRATIAEQLKVLGSMTRMERITSWVLVAVLAGFVTQNLHGIDPAWMALGGFLVLLGLNVVDKQGLKLIDWNFLLLFGTLVSMSDVIKSVGLNDLLSRWIAPVLRPLGGSPYLFLGAVAALTLAVRLVVPLQPTVLVMVVALLPIAAQMGYSPFTVSVVVLALSNNWFVPQQNSVYLGVFSATEERAFTHLQTRPLAIAHALLGVLAVLASVPIWQIMGIVPH